VSEHRHERFEREWRRTEILAAVDVAEFQFRRNNRHNEDIFESAIGGCLSHAAF
jgi:hypothetical protein